MQRAFWVIATITAVFAQVAICQDDSEQRIRKALEGRLILVKMDLPAVNSGVDFFLDDTNVSFDASDYNKLLKEYGVAIKKGTRSRITDVGVSAHGIEISLDGGGLPGSDWVVGNVKFDPPIATSKSDRELDLERQTQSDNNRGTADYLRGELEYERERRLTQDARNQESYQRARDLRSEYIEKNRKNWGSKVVVVVRSTNPSITMRDMVKSLAKYVELLPREKFTK